jgi:hypothetical protein
VDTSIWVEARRHPDRKPSRCDQRRQHAGRGADYGRYDVREGRTHNHLAAGQADSAQDVDIAADDRRRPTQCLTDEHTTRDRDRREEQE